MVPPLQSILSSGLRDCLKLSRGRQVSAPRKPGELCGVECPVRGGWSLRGLGVPHSSARREGVVVRVAGKDRVGPGHSCLLTGKSQRRSTLQRAPCPVLRARPGARGPQTDRLRIQQSLNHRSHAEESLLPESCSPSPTGQGPALPTRGHRPSGHLGSAKYPGGVCLRAAHAGSLLCSFAGGHRILGIGPGVSAAMAGLWSSGHPSGVTAGCTRYERTRTVPPCPGSRLPSETPSS